MYYSFITSRHNGVQLLVRFMLVKVYVWLILLTWIFALSWTGIPSGPEAPDTKALITAPDQTQLNWSSCHKFCDSEHLAVSSSVELSLIVMITAPDQTQLN